MINQSAVQLAALAGGILLHVPCYATSSFAQSEAAVQSVSRPVPIILETDIGPDCDDAGALAVLHALADNGEATILAMGCNSSSRWGAPALDAINTYYNRPDIPIGTWKGGKIMDYSKYNKHLAQSFPNDLKNGANAPDAAELYADILRKQPDGSVVIVSVGALNNLFQLLQAERELVRNKVKELVVMGGEFPGSLDQKAEFNFAQGRQRGDLPPATVTVVNEWPTPIVFSGHEIGAAIKTGAPLEHTPESNPVREAYARYVGLRNNRNSYDLTAVLYAVRGKGDYWSTVDDGSVYVLDDGRCEWRSDPDKRQSYLVPKMSTDQLEAVLNQLLCQPPKRDQ